MATGIVFDIKRYCVHDGPNIRTTVFLKGCPLQCWWCHNPEGRSRKPQLVHRDSRCIRCGTCFRACENKALVKDPRGLVVDTDRCDLCGACEKACPTGSMEIVGKQYTVAQLVDAIEKDRVFFEESGGGVTFSGGEPLAQWRFLLDALRECKRRDIHTVVDTSGFASRKVVESVRPYVDLFLFDLKLMDDARHKRFTGVSNLKILENLKLLVELGSQVVLVLPLIPGVNDDDGNLDALAVFAKDLGLVEIGLLPYHRMGSSKLGLVGMEDQMEGIREPSRERVDEAAARLASQGMKVRIGGR